MELPDRSQARSWEGKDVVDSDGSRLGRCVGVFADTATGQPEWLHIDVEGHVRSFVPAIDAVEHDGAVRVRFSRGAVLGAPSVGDDVQLSKAEEIELYRHYGVPVESGEGSVLPADDAAAATGHSTDTETTATPSTTATTSTAVGTAAAAGGVTPVAGIADRTSTGAASSSGADTSVAETDADVDGASGLHDRTGDTTALTPTTVADTDTDTDTDTASGGAVTPETGEELPVLDPAAASTQVIEDQVTYVDQPEDFVDGGGDVPPSAAAPAPEPEQPRPTLRRVPPASPPPTPAPAPSSSGSAAGGGAASALTPLGAVAGVAAAVALVLRARERRARRRASASARVGRLGDSLRAGSALARTSASSTLAGVSEAAELTRRSAATATTKAAKAAKAAAQSQQKAAAASRRQRSSTSSALAVASKTASEQKRAAVRSAAAQRRAARTALDAAATTAAQQRKAARNSLTAAATTAAQQRKAARKSLTGASRTAAKRRKAAAASLAAATSRSSSKADAVTAVPAKVAKRGRKARKSLGRKLWNLVLLGAGGGGYVLGAKAGRQRYDELSQVASAVAESPQVQSVTEAVTDPQRRADLLAEVQQQASSLVGRRGEPRA